MAKINLNKNPNLSNFQSRELDETIFDEPHSVGSGIGLTQKREYVPEFIRGDAENVISNANSYIVLGRDRPHSRTSGYGGIGTAAAHTIDIIVGRKAPTIDAGTRVFTDPSFATDAARIYIAEKTDVDTNFTLADGSNGSAVGVSAIALKADAIRIIGDEKGIKLVTKVNRRNTNNEIISSTSGIELIAGNDDSDLQPLVKGQNIVECVKSLIDEISDLNGVVASMLVNQTAFESLMVPLPITGQILAPSIAIKAKQNISNINTLVSQKANLATTKFSYLSSMGTGYILSSHNRVN